MKLKNFIPGLIGGLIVAVVMVVFAPSDGGPAVQKESAYDRVMRTGTLRCGYAVATPWFMVDPAKNEFSGVGYDFTNAVAQKNGWNIEWVEETGWGIAEQGLQSGRYDMMCGSVCVDPRRTRAAYYSEPFVYIPIFAVAKTGNDKFKTLDDINVQGVKVGVKNGHVFEYVTNERFPLAEKMYLSDLSDDTEFLYMVDKGKADISFSGQERIDQYNKHNGNQIKTVGEPPRMCGGAFMLPHGEDALKHTIDATINELNAAGMIDQIVKKYMPLDDRYIRLPAQKFRGEF